MKTSLGATYYGDGRCRFRVWAPLAERIEGRMLSPHERVVPMERYSQGYNQAVLDDCRSPQHYVYRLFRPAILLKDPTRHRAASLKVFTVPAR